MIGIAGTIASEQRATASTSGLAVVGRLVGPRNHGVFMVAIRAGSLGTGSPDYQQIVMSDRTGGFRFDGLTPGPVDLTILGFDRFEETTTVTIVAGEDTELEVQLTQPAPLAPAVQRACPCKPTLTRIVLVTTQ